MTLHNNALNDILESLNNCSVEQLLVINKATAEKYKENPCDGVGVIQGEWVYPKN